MAEGNAAPRKVVVDSTDSHSSDEEEVIFWQRVAFTEWEWKWGMKEALLRRPEHRRPLIFGYFWGSLIFYWKDGLQGSDRQLTALMREAKVQMIARRARRVLAGMPMVPKR